jgi:hypothetical protein
MYEHRFLLSYLHIRSLEDIESPTALTEALQSLSTGSEAYNEQYEKAMERVNSQSRGRKNID